MSPASGSLEVCIVPSPRMKKPDPRPLGAKMPQVLSALSREMLQRPQAARAAEPGVVVVVVEP